MKGRLSQEEMWRILDRVRCISLFSKQVTICMLHIKTYIYIYNCSGLYLLKNTKYLFTQAKKSLTVMYTKCSLLEGELRESD